MSIARVDENRFFMFLRLSPRFFKLFFKKIGFFQCLKVFLAIVRVLYADECSSICADE